ncbi:exonuclease SbcCD subunit D [Streptomyces aidingensis]|uniref:Nuclease SbcCD subunit D n=1 Tax=Streptomyces aidingensis TaxID=910347 RepID=A0A1I1PNS2_9ACTN|nr:exonuclease SbcCD subunit D [Streptomyces aidingensis]SFD09298.1 exonuclease SbcD [Streptomyces aidingensis]
MRFLHTSDWHLGRAFHRVGLLDAQRAFIDHLIATVRDKQADALLVSGDIYDRAVPPLPAVELFDETLHRLAGLGIPVIMISGNHDSPRRLGVGAGLLERSNIHLRTDPESCGEPVLLHDAHGGIAVYPLPYLEPALVRERLGAERPGHTEVLAAAMRRVRRDLAARPAGTRSVVLAHAFVTGGEESDSERDITAGGAASVPRTLFDGVDYVALGHLHGAQALTERIRYSGSPLAYSFSETGHRKSLWLIGLGPGGRIEQDERLDCPVPRPLARLRGTLDHLLTDPALEECREHWVEATLTDPGRPPDPMARLGERFPHLLSLVFEPRRAAGTPAGPRYGDRLRDRTDQQIAGDFLRHVRGGREPDPGEGALLAAALEGARTQEQQR